jgi:hypothetical protein
MGAIEDGGVRVDLPTGWEGRILRRSAGVTDLGRVTPMAAPPNGGLVAQVANFALPAEVGDFGGGAVELMRAPDIFVSLVEYDEASQGTALFAPQGIPRLRPTDFDPATMQRTIAGQSGAQRFFSVGDRPFCLYVALGSHLRRVRTGPVVAELIRRISITPR